MIRGRRIVKVGFEFREQEDVTQHLEAHHEDNIGKKKVDEKRLKIEATHSFIYRK